jgi:hypothetical protein
MAKGKAAGGIGCRRNPGGVGRGKRIQEREDETVVKRRRSRVVAEERRESKSEVAARLCQ